MLDTDHRIPAPRRTANRPSRRRILAALAVAILSTSGVATVWALDRFVVDHVVVEDVSALEAEAAISLDVSATPETDSTDEVVVDDDTYVSDAVSIGIAEVSTGTGDDTITYYVADVVLSDATVLRSAFANDQYGTNVVADTSDIAADNDAVFAINGDYYGFREDGILIRNGVVYRDEGVRTGLAIYLDGHMEIYDETTTSAQELVDAGVWNTLSFGPGLLENGEIIAGIEEVEVDTNFGNHSIQGDQPRTGIGMISENHFVFVVVDGRSPGYSAGVTMTEFAAIFEQLGATVAYNLDGGGSSTMWFDGEVVNDPLGRGEERGVSDILYVGE